MKLRQKFAKFIAVAVIGMMSVTSFASDLPILTLEQAIKGAISADSAQSEASDAQITAANVVMGSTSDPGTSAYQNTYYGKLDKEQTAKYHKDALTYKATKLYNNIALLEKKVAFYDEKLALQEKLYSQTELKYQKGLVSKLDFITAESTIKEQRTAKDKAQAELDSNRADFRELTGYDLSRYSLEEHFEVEYFDYVGNIYNFFNSSVDEMLQYQEKLADVADTYAIRDTLMKDNSGSSYFNAKASAASAKSQVESARSSYLNTLNSLYSSLESTKQSIKELEVTLEDKKNTLEALKLRLEKGLASEIEVEQTELAIKEMELNLIQLKVAYNSTKDAVRKPWVSFY